MRRTIASLCALCVGLSLSAQDINQTVSITNTYKSGVRDIEKMAMEPGLPDTVTVFDYHFDYSVFDTPYRGAFEFTPYSVRLTPQSADSGAHRLYVLAGAGYGLYPELKAVWTPSLKAGGFGLDVFQDFNGYYGKYRTVRRNIDNYPMYTTKGERYTGYDFDETFGLEGRYVAESFETGAAVAYNGIFNRDEQILNSFNSIVANASIRRRGGNRGMFYYAADLKLDFASDNLSHPYQSNVLRQGDVDLSVTVGPKVSERFGLMIDGRIKVVTYGNAPDFARNYLGYAVTPHIELALGPVDLYAGVKLDGAGSFNVAPDVHASMSLADNRIKLSAAVTGGTVFNTYADMRRTCHWYCPAYSEVLRNGVERINARLGIEGSILKHLQYKLDGGWASVTDMPVWAVVNLTDGLNPRMVFAAYNYSFANLALAWKSSRVDVDGALHFRKTSMGGGAGVFDLPLLSGELKGSYNWAKRIYAGLSVDGATARRSVVSGRELFMDGYVDLGVFAEYKVNTRWSLWVKGGNLLNQTIQLSPMHAENGISGTAGVSFCL